MYFEADHAIYEYEVCGDGTPLVLLHGFTGSKSTWLPFIDQWKEKFQVIIIDLPGHGKTKVKSEGTMESYCGDLIQLFNHLHIDTCHVLGYSMGGRMALSLTLLYPERIKSLILESSSPGLQYKEERESRKKNDENLARKIEEEGIKSFVHYWENIPLFATQKELPDKIFNSLRKERLSQSKEGLALSLRTMGTGSQPTWWDKLSTVNQDVLLIVGEIDQKFVIINEEMNRKLINGELIIIKNAGHAIHVEEPEKFDKLVTAFLN